MIELTMPKLGLTMEEGIIAQWHKNAGETIREGEVLLSIETDKATLDVEAEHNGVLLEILVPAGGKAPVGAPIARVSGPGENPAAPQAAVVRAEDVQPVEVAPEVPSCAPTASERVKASPAVRRRARELGIDPSTIRGSAPGGRVILRDLPLQPQPQEVTAAVPVATASELPGRTLAISPIRRAVAASMSEAAAVPQFRVTRAVDLTQTLALHEALRPFLDRAQVKVSVTDFLIQACALALVANREVNASFVSGERASGGQIRLHDQVNIGLAMVLPDGLVAPVLRDADRITLVETARRRQGLAAAARSGRLNAREMTGATFTLSNLGPMGVDQFDAIVTPPQAAVLAAGRVIHQPVAHGTEGIRVRPSITLTVTADHRVIDGALAAVFLRTVATVLEGASEYRLFEPSLKI